MNFVFGPALADAAGHVESVDPGHVRVEKHDSGRTVRLDESQGRPTARRNGRIHTPARDDFLENTSIGGVVVDDQNRETFQSGSIRRERRRVVRFKPYGQAEFRSLAGVARHFDFSVHQLDQPFRNGEAESGAAIFSRRRRISLLKGLENAFLLIRRDADAGIPNAELQLNRILRAHSAHFNDDFALVRELDRVADEVHEHLAQTIRVSNQPARHVRLNPARHLEVLFVGVHGETAQRVRQVPLKVEFHTIELQFAGLNLGHVEHVVENRHQACRRGRDDVGVLVLFGR